MAAAGTVKEAAAGEDGSRMVRRAGGIYVPGSLHVPRHVRRRLKRRKGAGENVGDVGAEAVLEVNVKVVAGRVLGGVGASATALNAHREGIHGKV